MRKLTLASVDSSQTAQRLTLYTFLQMKGFTFCSSYETGLSNIFFEQGSDTLLPLVTVSAITNITAKRSRSIQHAINKMITTQEYFAIFSSVNWTIRRYIRI